MTVSSPAFVRLKLCVEFAALKHACLKGIYVAPIPDESLTWTGVLFPRKGPYADSVLRFQIRFPEDYPSRAPVVTFSTDVFHPLITPLTTYTYSNRDSGADTVSSANAERLPPGGFALRHGFPDWFDIASGSAVQRVARHGESTVIDEESGLESGPNTELRAPPHIGEVLQYMKLVFDTEAVIDSIPLEMAANSGAWHAWRSHRSQTPGRKASLATSRSPEAREPDKRRSLSPRQQPGGARRPGEWNWQGVWEDRVRKNVQASNSEPALFGDHGDEVINFLKADPDMPKESPGAVAQR